MNDIYVQCEMRRKDGQIRVAWIPQKYAVKGKYLEILGINGWRVEACYDKKPYSELEPWERGYLTQRLASDV